MSIAGGTFIIVWFFFLIINMLRNSTKIFEEQMFKLMIAISIFVNVGIAVFNRSFTFISEILYIVTALIAGVGINKIKKKTIYALIILFICISISYTHLAFGINLPEVIPMNERMDDAYYIGFSVLTKATFSKSNISSFIYFIIFIVCILTSKEYTEIDKVNELLKFVEKCFKVFFVIWTLESIINNLVSPTELRNFIYMIWGGGSDVKTYYPQLRNGFYGFTGLFSEQSYIGIMIVYYAIKYVKGISSTRDFVWVCYSMIILVINGSTTGIALIPMAVLIIIRYYTVTRKITKKQIFGVLFITLILIISLIIIILLNRNLLSNLLYSAQIKISTYFLGGSGYSTAEQRSAAIRSLSNSIAFDAFKMCPVFGIGIGTSRAYGILIGTFLSFGIVGTIAYYNFISKALSLKLNQKNIMLFILVIVYSYLFLFVWYIYYPCFIPLYLCFQDQEFDK